jgi:hypothetical protein
LEILVPERFGEVKDGCTSLNPVFGNPKGKTAGGRYVIGTLSDAERTATDPDSAVKIRVKRKLFSIRESASISIERS